jgi:hypothetical protein
VTTATPRPPKATQTISGFSGRLASESALHFWEGTPSEEQRVRQPALAERGIDSRATPTTATRQHQRRLFMTVIPSLRFVCQTIEM